MRSLRFADSFRGDSESHSCFDNCSRLVFRAHELDLICLNHFVVGAERCFLQLLSKLDQSFEQITTALVIVEPVRSSFSFHLRLFLSALATLRSSPATLPVDLIFTVMTISKAMCFLYLAQSLIDSSKFAWIRLFQYSSDYCWRIAGALD